MNNSTAPLGLHYWSQIDKIRNLIALCGEIEFISLAHALSSIIMF